MWGEERNFLKDVLPQLCVRVKGSRSNCGAGPGGCVLEGGTRRCELPQSSSARLGKWEMRPKRTAGTWKPDRAVGAAKGL